MESPEPTSPPVEDGLRVIRIMPDSRYCIVAPDTMSKDDLLRLLQSLQRWFDEGAQFLIVQGVKLVRVNGPAPEEGTSDTDGN